MAHMPDIAREAAEAVFHHRHDQEEPVTTPAQPQRNVIADLSAVLSELSANSLISRLFAARLGSRLTGDQIDHVTAIVEAIETAAVPGSAWQPAQAQQAAGQPA